MEMARYTRSQLKTIRKDKYFFFYYLNRADGQENQNIEWKICGNKSRERQNTKYPDSLNNIVTRKESPSNKLIRRTDDSEDWKAMIADVCSRPGT